MSICETRKIFVDTCYERRRSTHGSALGTFTGPTGRHHISIIFYMSSTGRKEVVQIPQLHYINHQPCTRYGIFLVFQPQSKKKRGGRKRRKEEKGGEEEEKEGGKERD